MKLKQLFCSAALFAAVCVMAALPASAKEKVETGRLLNGGYAFTLTKCSGKEHKLSDYTHKSSVRIAPGSSVKMEGPAEGEDHANAMYLFFVKTPPSFSLTYTDASGSVIRTDEYGTENDPVYFNCLYLKEYAVEIPNGTAGIELVSGGDGYVAELRLYGTLEEVPETAELWLPSFEKADVLFVVAHPDDEHLMMGGLLPIYAGQQNKKVQMVYLTADLTMRKSEALRGLWSNGVRNVPVFLDMIDKKTDSLDAALAVWERAGLDPVQMLTEQIRRFRPEIVVTHDVNGEYGHGAHRASAYYMTRAVELAADASYDPESAGKYGTWQVKKFYLHLYGEKETQTVLPVDEPLSAFGGKTAFEMAQTGFKPHEGSQGDKWYSLLRSRVYDCAVYGLVSSTVGEDELKNDFFEHLEEENK